MREAEQSLAQAQLNLTNATLLAPFAGVVTTVDIVPGSFVTSGSGIITIINRDPLHVDLRLNENDVAQVTLGQKVVLGIDALRDWQNEGTVSYISPVGTDANGVVTFDVTVDFPDDDARVKVGMSANVDITVSERSAVLLVPNTALLPNGSQQIVQRRAIDGTIGTVVVETGLTDGIHTEIISGLNEGDEIVAVPNISNEPESGGLFPLP
ncbi:efflux RND transporter periplasmic adaptor subunit [Candidatus Gracilibacteria bacterium]|nr:efflux RND transporter periplasmic adaptor subunit [Candidatus Gracilibacteria bacterium]